MVLYFSLRYRCFKQTLYTLYPAMRGYRGFFWVLATPPPPPPPPPTAVCKLFLLVDLPRALQQFGSAPEIPVRNPPF